MAEWACCTDSKYDYAWSMRRGRRWTKPTVPGTHPSDTSKRDYQVSGHPNSPTVREEHASTRELHSSRASPASQRTRPPWKFSRPDVEVAWWPLGRCCIHLACIAAQPLDQTSLPSDGLFRMNDLRMGISTAAPPITREEAPRRALVSGVELRPASRGMSVGPAIGDDIHAGCERTECPNQALGVYGHRGSHFSHPLSGLSVCW